MGNIQQLLDDGETIVAPGVFDPLSALLARRAGFKALYLGGFAAAAQLGTAEPLASLEEQASSSRAITSVVDLPLLIDGHTGFGDPVHTYRATRKLIAYGVAGAHFEDALYPKRVHYFRGVVRTVSMEDMQAKIRAARKAAEGTGFLVIARTEAWSSVGGGLDEAIRRLHGYVEAGADALMPLAWNPKDAEAIGKEFSGIPLVWVARARRDDFPELSLSEIRDMGYRIVLYPATSVGVAYKAVTKLYEAIATSGRTETDEAELDPVWAAIDEVIGMPTFYDIERETTEPEGGFVRAV